MGFNNHQWLLGAEWYIGYMLFAMIIIYPFLSKWFDVVSSFAAPIISLVLYGYLASKYNTIMESDRMVRAFAGILIGISAFQNVKKIKSRGVRNYLWRMYPVMILLFYIAYMNTCIDRSIQPMMVVLLWSALIFTFAEEGMISKSGLLNTRIVYWLGQISLPVYMIQNVSRVAAKTLYNNNNVVLWVFEVALTLFTGVASFYIVCFFQKAIKAS